MRGADERHYHHLPWTKINEQAAANRPTRLSQPLDRTRGAGQYHHSLLKS